MNKISQEISVDLSDGHYHLATYFQHRKYTRPDGTGTPPNTTLPQKLGILPTLNRFESLVIFGGKFKKHKNQKTVSQMSVLFLHHLKTHTPLVYFLILLPTAM